MNKVRPFLKWAGSKYNCIQEVIHSLPQGHRLIEPFGGSAVVFLNTNYSSYVVGESNPDLIDLYSHLKTHGHLFIDQCERYFKPDFNNKERYYNLRQEFNGMAASEARSALFLYLNRHGYNGLCRYNSKGIYNVPFGLYVKPYFPRNEMLLFHQKSQQAHFLHQDFRKTFKSAKVGDVIYCDPPYVPFSEHNKPFNYNKNRFGLDDQIELAQLAQQTAKRGIPVIISNHDTPFTRQHYQNAQIKSFLVQRWINCKGEARKPVKELIAIFSPK